MSKVCYIDSLPIELLHIIYEKSKKIEQTNTWSHGYEYCRLYDCSRQHRKNRKKAICYYNYETRDWIFWNWII